MWHFQYSPQATAYYGYFCKKIGQQDISKMAQSGHTERYEELIYYYPLHLRLLILKVVDG